MNRLWILRAVLVFASFVFISLLAEGTLRVLYAMDRTDKGTLEQRLLRSRNTTISDGRSTDMGGLVQASEFSNVVYELKPNLDCTFYNSKVRTNSRGFRGRDYATPKPTNTFRIVGIGDSVMFGWGVNEEDSFLAGLERQLNALPQPHPVFEVLNFAVPGYNTTLEAATLEHRAMPYEPDLVILHFVNNDFGVPSFMMRPRRAPAWHKSRLLEFIRARAGRLSRTYEDEGLVFSRFRNVEEEVRVNVLREYAYMVGLDGFNAATRLLRDLTTGAPRKIPLVVVAGFKDQGQRDVVEAAIREHGFEELDMGDFVEAAMDAKGFPKDPDVRNRALWLSPGDHHPNPFGHSLYTDALLDCLLTRRLVPAPLPAPDVAH